MINCVVNGRDCRGSIDRNERGHSLFTHYSLFLSTTPFGWSRSVLMIWCCSTHCFTTRYRVLLTMGSNAPYSLTIPSLFTHCALHRRLNNPRPSLQVCSDLLLSIHSFAHYPLSICSPFKNHSAHYPLTILSSPSIFAQYPYTIGSLFAHYLLTIHSLTRNVSSTCALFTMRLRS